MSFVLFALFSFSLWFLISQADLPLYGAFRDRILERHALRVQRFLDCAFCSGFWVSLGVAYALHGLSVTTLVWALAGAGATLLLHGQVLKH